MSTSACLDQELLACPHYPVLLPLLQGPAAAQVQAPQGSPPLWEAPLFHLMLLLSSSKQVCFCGLTIGVSKEFRHPFETPSKGHFTREIKIFRIYTRIYTPYICRIYGGNIYTEYIYMECRKAIYTAYILHTYIRRINIYTELANPTDV